MTTKILLTISLLCLGLQYFAQTTSIYPPLQIPDTDSNAYDEDTGSGGRPVPLAMVFLGACQGTNFYYNNVVGTQLEARSGCQDFGMRLATFASHLQLQCVTLALDNSITTAWTDGVFFLNPRSFQSGGTVVASDITVSYIQGNIFALVLNKNNTAPRLTSTLYSTIRPSICML